VTDLTEYVQAGYRGDMDARPAYLSSPAGMGYLAGMAHRLAGRRYPSKASTGRGYRVNVGAISYNTDGPDCQEARLIVAGNHWAEAQTA
jgi:hypothetical protein